MALYQVSYDLQKQIITLSVTTEVNPAATDANVMTLQGSLSLTKLLRKFIGLFWFW
ncbi:hypothetical protein ACOSHH_002955 [Klebsiella aerogenes]